MDDFADDLELGSGPSADIVLKQLTTAWVNEKNSPELLKHVTELVDVMMLQLEEMETNLLTLSRDDFRLVPHQMEANRIRFILASYHRCRLEKIETFAAYLVNRDNNCHNDSERLMSVGELNFAEEFILNQKDHFFDEAYRYMPNLLADEERNQTMEITPNLNSSVFIRMLRRVDNVLINNELKKLEVGSRHLLPYREVSYLIKDGSAILI